ncbi:MAG: TIGR03618 family F420-dependent PPOX class oxidoreductase [Actinomycetota bacterium]|nr:TIGR03618 family F420-dependent PPOX class oxidoreductase [Actinomycetota bacterium]
MATIDDAPVRRLLEQPNHAVVSTYLEDGSVHGTVVWVNLEDGRLAMNSAVGRTWPTNLQRDPRLTVVVYDQGNPYEYVEVRGRASGRTEGADEHIDRLAKKYLGVEHYPYRGPDEQRIMFVVEPDRVRHQKQG